MKILQAPMNFAMQPVLLTEALNRKGIEANHLQFQTQRHLFNFRGDLVYRYDSNNCFNTQMRALEDCLAKDYDIYHFWQRSLLYRKDNRSLSGLDIPLIKAHGKKVVHRFTGFDLRMPGYDMEVNPYSPFNHGFLYPFNVGRQIDYIEFLKEHVDQFLVQDPEMQQFMPEAKILPRALDLEEWKYIGVEKTDRPLVVHAPTNPGCKGTKYIKAAVKTLQSEGLAFDFKLIEGMSHDEAKAWYRKSDIIVDQILIGATGVLTLEGWALGKPVVVYLREDLFKPFYGGGDLPVANANPDTITDVLRKLIKDQDWRDELAVKGRELVEGYHDLDAVTDQCIEIYKDVMQKETPSSPGVQDIVYFSRRLNEFRPLDEVAHRMGMFIKRHMPFWLYKRAVQIKKSLPEPAQRALSLPRQIINLIRRIVWRVVHYSKRSVKLTLWAIKRVLRIILGSYYSAYVHIRRNKAFADIVEDKFSNEKIDICIAHDSFSLQAAQKLRDMHKADIIYDAVEIPLLQYRSGKFLRSMPRFLQNKIEQTETPIIEQACHITTVGPALAAWLEGRYGVATEDIRNTRGFEKIGHNDAIREAAGLQSGDKLILFLNTVSPDYGFENLLKAVQIMKDETLHVGVLGRISPPDYQKTLETLVKKLGLSGRVHFFPPLPYDEMLSFATGADFGAITLQQETLNLKLSCPNRIFDAVAARLPVASSNIESISQIIEAYQIGEVYDETDPEDMARVMRGMLQEKKLRTCRENTEKAAKELSWENERLKLEPIVGKEPKKIVILARKDADDNARIRRFSEYLSGMGHTVFVVAPSYFLKHKLDNVRYITADDGRLAQQRRKDALADLAEMKSQHNKRRADLFEEKDRARRAA